MWVVELNIARWRVRRWVDQRWHLLAPDPRSFIPGELRMRTTDATTDAA